MVGKQLYLFQENSDLAQDPLAAHSNTELFKKATKLRDNLNRLSRGTTPVRSNKEWVYNGAATRSTLSIQDELKDYTKFFKHCKDSVRKSKVEDILNEGSNGKVFLYAAKNPDKETMPVFGLKPTIKIPKLTQ